MCFLILSWKCVPNTIVISKITCHILRIDCLLIALDAHMFSHNGYGPRTKDQGSKAAGPGPRDPQLLGLAPWSWAHIHYG